MVCLRVRVRPRGDSALGTSALGAGSAAGFFAGSAAGFFAGSAAGCFAGSLEVFADLGLELTKFKNLSNTSSELESLPLSSSSSSTSFLAVRRGVRSNNNKAETRPGTCARRRSRRWLGTRFGDGRGTGLLRHARCDEQVIGHLEADVIISVICGGRSRQVFGH